MDKIQKTIFEGAIPSELSGEFILPDTYPDVKKILRVRARPVQIGQYIGGGGLEFNGAVDYIVVFSADGDPVETLHSVHFASDYKGGVSPEGIGEKTTVVCEPRISAVTARLSNPRKISLRSTVTTDVKLLCEASTKPKVEPDPDAPLEKLTETTPTLVEYSFLADHVKLSENLEPDPSQPAIDAIITCDAEINFHEVKPQKSDEGLSASIKGEAVIDCVYKAQTEPGDYRSFTRKIPLSLVVGADEYAGLFEGAVPGTLIMSAAGVPTEINASVGENSYGERRVLELDLAFDVNLTLYAENETTLTLDAYSVDHESECGFERLDIIRLGKQVFSNFSVNESVGREEIGLTDPERQWIVVDSQADVVIDSARIERGRAQMSGTASVSAIIASEHEFAPLDFKVPVKCELGVGELREPIAFSCESGACDLRVRIDGTRVSCDFEVTLSAVFFGLSRRDIVGSVTLSGDKLTKSDDPSEIILCYPAAGEGLWQVAKRYKSTMAALESANPGFDGKVVKIM